MMTQLTDNVWAVEVPDGAKDLDCEKSMTGTPYLFYKFKDDELLNEYQDINLPPGSYRFLFTTKTATEEDARKVVESMPCGRKKIYKGVKDDGNEVWYESPLESLRSLLRSKGLDENKNYAIIEKLSSDDR